MDAVPSAFNEALDYAIAREQEAQAFYEKLKRWVKDADMKAVLQQFVGEERKHEEKLEDVKAGKLYALSGPMERPNLHLADRIVPVEVGSDMTLSQVLSMAMQKEKEAYRLYLDLARQVEEEELVELFLALAQEEANHKVRLEIEYDEWILSDD